MTRVDRLQPAFYHLPELHKITAEVLVGAHHFVAEVTIPLFLVPDSPHWAKGVRIAQVKAGKALAGMINDRCASRFVAVEN